MPALRFRRLRRLLTGRPARGGKPPKAMDHASIRERRRAFENLPEVPPCPEGWRVGPPDFVIFGAQKSGTTWWFRMIEQHPGVFQPKNQRPELHFFDRLYDRWPDEESMAAYYRYFPRPEGILVGEKTPEYLSCMWAPPMVALAAPESKAIVLLRDPVDRFVSGLSHFERGGLISEDPEMGRAFGDRVRVVTDAIERSMYGRQLDWLLTAYPRERLLILQYERCAAQAQQELSRTFSFLGLPDHDLAPEVLAQPRNKSMMEKVSVPDRHLDLLRRYYRPEVERVLALAPDFDLSLWPNFRDLA